MEWRERRDAEIEAIQAIYDGDDDVRLRAHRHPRASREGRLGDGDDDQGGDAEGVVTWLEVRVGGATRFAIELPPDYPGGSSAAAAPKVVPISGSGLSDDVWDAIGEAIDDSQGGECLWQLISSVRELTLVGSGEDARAASASSSDDDKSDEDDEAHTIAAAPTPVSSSHHTSGSTRGGEAVVPKLGRRLCYSHHIIAPSKRRAIVAWAVELALGGCSKIGWPGLILVEGDDANCRAYVESLQRLRWKHFVVRGEQTVEGAPHESIDALRALPRGFAEFGASEMSEFAAYCRSAGLEALFLRGLNLPPPKEGGAGGGGGGPDGDDAKGNAGGKHRGKAARNKRR